ncbi:MAG: type II toxin-antitoxin system RelE/ParE family toxin [Bauldia sp.]|nr:type II toxin-antitoxin system RelE/ParE family toxin [Bauldia sp.]
MIRSLRGAPTRQFIERGRSSFSGMNVALAYQRLSELNAAPSLSAMSPLKSVGLHKLKGDRKGYWAIRVNGPWRIVFRFEDGDAHDVEIVDYHEG